MNRLGIGVWAATAGLFAAPAFAELPYGSLEFLDRTGTVAADQPIEVWLRFTIDAQSPGLDFSSNPLSGFDPADLPTQGTYYDGNTNQYVTSDFAEITGAFLNTYYVCSGSFTAAGCNEGNYHFDFFTNSQPGKPSINFRDSFTLAAGASFDYLFGSFIPTAGGAAPGTYQFYGTGVTLNFRGVDADGHELTFDVTLAATCPGGESDACAFTRNVTAVPEPANWGLMAVGLLGLAGVSRRRSSR